MGFGHNTVKAKGAARAPGSQRPTPWRGSLALGWIYGAGTTCLLLTSAVKTAAHAGADVGGRGTQAAACAGFSSGQEHLGSNPEETGSLGIQCLSEPFMGPGSAPGLFAGRVSSTPTQLGQPWAGPSESQAFHSLSRPAWTDARWAPGHRHPNVTEWEAVKKRGDGGGRAGVLATGPPPTCLMGSPLWGPLPSLRPFRSLSSLAAAA